MAVMVAFIDGHRESYPVAVMCGVLETVRRHCGSR